MHLIKTKNYKYKKAFILKSEVTTFILWYRGSLQKRARVEVERDIKGDPERSCGWGGKNVYTFLKLPRK